MGSRIAKRLIDAGHHVTGYNRTRSKAQVLVDAGMQWGDSPRQVAECSQFTFSMVTNTSALLAITGGPDGILAGLAPGKPEGPLLVGAVVETGLSFRSRLNNSPPRSCTLGKVKGW